VVVYKQGLYTVCPKTLFGVCTIKRKTFYLKIAVMFVATEG